MNRPLGPVHMIPGQLIAPGQLTDPGVNFASVHGLTPATVHMSFSLPGATSRGGLAFVQHRVIRLAEVRACSHEPWTVNYPGASVTSRSHDDLLSRGKFMEI